MITSTTSPSITALRWASLAEAVSFLLLLGAVVVKYGFDAPLGVRVLGPVHGMLFITYVTLVLLCRDDLRWSPRATLTAILLAIVPGGTLFLRKSLPPEPTAG